MLVLSRKMKEAVGVGETDGSECLLKVTVLEIRGGCVRLGFESADKVPVHRWEIWERLHNDCQSVKASKDAEMAVSC